MIHFDKKTRWIWTSENTLWCVDWLHFCGYPLNAKFINKYFFRLYIKGIEFFGSWDNTLATNGLDFKKIRKCRPKRSVENIIREIREIKKRMEPLNYAYLEKNYESLLNATKRNSRFGLAFFVEEAGFDYARESKHVSLKVKLKKLNAEKINRLRKKFGSKRRPSSENSAK